MLALAQRVLSAEITLDNQILFNINRGIVIFVCFETDDDKPLLNKFIDKITSFYFFSTHGDRLDSSIQDIDGEIAIISQFSLAATTKKGKKPSYHQVAPTEKAKKLYSTLEEHLKKKYSKSKFGIFGANMQIKLINDGPLTFNFSF
tara:strand:+ start:113 stop:550 length:438 start_codon:yes stop_codon:yes gene_type:complete